MNVTSRVLDMDICLLLPMWESPTLLLLLHSIGMSKPDIRSQALGPWQLFSYQNEVK
jgi:hypothetical protein